MTFSFPAFIQRWFFSTNHKDIGPAQNSNYFKLFCFILGLFTLFGSVSMVLIYFGCNESQYLTLFGTLANYQALFNNFLLREYIPFYVDYTVYSHVLLKKYNLPEISPVVVLFLVTFGALFCFKTVREMLASFLGKTHKLFRLLVDTLVIVFFYSSTLPFMKPLSAVLKNYDFFEAFNSEKQIFSSDVYTNNFISIKKYLSNEEITVCINKALAKLPPGYSGNLDEVKGTLAKLLLENNISEANVFYMLQKKLQKTPVVVETKDGFFTVAKSFLSNTTEVFYESMLYIGNAVGSTFYTLGTGSFHLIKEDPKLFFVGFSAIVLSLCSISYLVKSKGNSMEELASEMKSRLEANSAELDACREQIAFLTKQLAEQTAKSSTEKESLKRIYKDLKRRIEGLNELTSSEITKNTAELQKTQEMFSEFQTTLNTLGAKIDNDAQLTTLRLDAQRDMYQRLVNQYNQNIDIQHIVADVLTRSVPLQNLLVEKTVQTVVSLGTDFLTGELNSLRFDVKKLEGSINIQGVDITNLFGIANKHREVLNAHGANLNKLNQDYTPLAAKFLAAGSDSSKDL